jgi:hypothetical protein
VKTLIRLLVMALAWLCMCLDFGCGSVTTAPVGLDGAASTDGGTEVEEPHATDTGVPLDVVGTRDAASVETVDSMLAACPPLDHYVACPGDAGVCMTCGRSGAMWKAPCRDVDITCVADCGQCAL